MSESNTLLRQLLFAASNNGAVGIAPLEDTNTILRKLVYLFQNGGGGGGGTGDVVGPASSISGNVAFFSGLTGKVIQDLGLSLPTGFISGDKLVTTGTDGVMRADVGAADLLVIAPTTSGAGGVQVSTAGVVGPAPYHISGGATLDSGSGQVISLASGSAWIYSQDALAFDIFNRTLNGLDGGLAIDFEDQAAIALYSAIIGDGTGSPSSDSVARNLIGPWTIDGVGLPAGYASGDKFVITKGFQAIFDVTAEGGVHLFPTSTNVDAGMVVAATGTGTLDLQVGYDPGTFGGTSAILITPNAVSAIFGAIIGDGAGNPSIDSVAREASTGSGVVFKWSDDVLEVGSPGTHNFFAALSSGNLTANRTISWQDRAITVAGLDDTVAEVFSSAPTTGSTVNPTYTKSKSLVALTPAGSLLALTVNMPNAATYPGGTWTLHSTEIITGLTLTPAGGSVIGATTTFAAVNGSCTYMSDGTNWRKVSGL